MISGWLKRFQENLVTQRSAVVVITILLVATAIGWVLTELIPADFPEKRELLAARWGEIPTRLVELLRLYDPFHSFWYSAVLAIFFIVLLLCVLSRWRRFIKRSRPESFPESAAGLERLGPRLELSWRTIGGEASVKDPFVWYAERYGKKAEIDGELLPALCRAVVTVFKRRGYRTATKERNDGIAFTASAGRWRFLGGLIFHIGILVITVGGVIGSFWGWNEFLYGKAGDILPLYGSSFSILVDDFRIIATGGGEIKDYITGVKLIGEEGDTLGAAEIEVNHPLRFAGVSIYQSSYSVDDSEFEWTRVVYTTGELIGSGSVTLAADKRVPLEGTSLSLRALRLLPDFRMSPSGPYSASGTLANPALEVEIAWEGGSETGWVFLYYPRFNTSFESGLRLELIDIEPLYYTGLQVASNPGSPVLIAGILVSTLGAILLLIFDYRSVAGLIGREGILVAGRAYRWKVSFEKEFEDIGSCLREDVSAVLKNAGG